MVVQPQARTDSSAGVPTTHPTGHGLAGPDSAPTGALLEGCVPQMQALLARVRPSSDAEALRALRTAFPSASLADRVAVLSRRRG